MEQINYQSNSDKSREGKDEVRFEKVVTGEVKHAEKSLPAKVLDLFLPDGVSDWKTYLVHTLLIPNIKKTCWDMATAFRDGLFGTTGSSSASRPNVERYSYDKCSKNVQRYSTGEQLKTRIDSTFDYNFTFDSRGEAEVVLNKLRAIIKQYGHATILNFYDIIEVTPPNYMVSEFGWLDLDYAQIRRDGDRYLLKLPRAIELD